MPSLGSVMFCLAALLALEGAAQAQAPPISDSHARHAAPPAPASSSQQDDANTGRWQVNFDARAFVGFNYQRREFTDFHEIESQNWIMASLERRVSRASIALVGMFSLEPFTIQDLGSPQVFQTGETFRGAPLIDYQHPHDLIMSLGSRFERTIGSVTTKVDVRLVGTPALGPQPFMHRASAADNSQAPLGHHNLDSTHITHGVLTGGVAWRGVGLEASWFRGREPDEDRLDLDLGALDSWALRGSWSSGPWSLQVSGARLKEPEIVHPYDETRLTASIAYTGVVRERPAAVLLAWGQNRENFGIFDAYLLEAHVNLTSADALFSRAELVTKNILGGGFHPPGFQHQHPHSRIGALTGGYVRDVFSTPHGRVGVGGDVSVYRVPQNLRFNYGTPLSFHVFLRYARAPRSSHVTH